MSKLEEIKSILIQFKPVIEQKYHITALGIFGDYVKGNESDNNEVNILVDYVEPPSLLDLVDMEYFLTDLLQIKADIISKNGLKGARRERILSEVVYV